MFSALFRRTRPSAAPQLTLHENQGVQQLRIAAGQSLRIHVQQGTLWLTEAGKQQDRVLQAGQHLLLTGPAQLVLSALGPAACAVQLRTSDAHVQAGAAHLPEGTARQWHLRAAS